MTAHDPPAARTSKAPDAAARPGNFVLYDGDCPVCRRYMAIASLRTLRPDVAVVDARAAPALVADLRGQGIDVNDSMVVGLIGDDGRQRLYTGGAATRLIYDLASEAHGSRRLALWALGGAPWRHALYPWLRASRNGLLRLGGIPPVP